MNKAILIGNGFTSQLIFDYLDINMKSKLKRLNSETFEEIDRLFNPFRLLDKNTSFNSKNRKEHVINQLKKFNFDNIEDIYELFFIKYGLINETGYEEMYSIESILKVVRLFKMKNRFDDEYEKNIIRLANIVYFNDGKYGLKDTKLKSYDRIISFFEGFDSVFTTNYDLILDDICQNDEKVFHLHGSFMHKRTNIKSNERLNAENAFLLWAIHGEEKLEKLDLGFWSDFSWDRFSWASSLLVDYLKKLKNDNFFELHIFGFSGANDQHINDSICKNKSLGKIYYYCEPELVNDREKKKYTEKLFEKSDAIVELVSWSKIWNAII